MSRHSSRQVLWGDGPNCPARVRSSLLLLSLVIYFTELMFDSSLLEFSRSHCVSICAVLVPANLLATLATLTLIGLNRPTDQIVQSVGIASLCALVMVLHVLTWFMVGVVMVPTYVLLTLGAVCLGVNLWAIGHRPSLRHVVQTIGRWVTSRRVRSASAS